MQARKIDLRPYTVELIQQRVNPAGELVEKTVSKTVNPVDWLTKHLLAPAAGHNLTELVAAMDIMGKVRAATAEEGVLIETAEWELMKTVLDKIKGYSEEAGQMGYRILAAPAVEVSEKKTKEPSE